MKTGTPVRIDGKSIDFSKLTEQGGDNDFHCFSYLHYDYRNTLIQRPCYMAYTNEAVHHALRQGFTDSPLFNGTIQSVGPRYCPSIETKLNTFADRTSHHLFLEPEGETTTEFYLNGFSSSLPWDVQLTGLRLIEGFENVRIFRPGYAIEYDYFPPTQLYHTLETKLIQGLYFAGQINGTTGYEEAAAQGLMAGINAHLSLHSSVEFVLNRDEAYIGVLIDDLVTKGVDEPYRMFTSRAEYRILLRQDDADMRLTPKGFQIGLVTNNRHKIYLDKIEKRDLLIDFIKNLNQKVTSIYNLIAKNDNEKISLRYSCFLKQELTYENILALYKKNHQRDIRYMQSHLGIHKDDLKIFMNGNAADLFASQGQQRTIVLSLKIALIELIKDEIGEYPVLLLDDVLSELDEARKNMLLDILNQKIQTFITTTSIDGINHQIVEKAKKIYIKGGKEAT